MKVISVFGSSAPKPGSFDYKQAQMVGRLLAERGYAVATGGYMGTMEAASRGANEAGGHVIGVTSDRIEAFRPIKPNPYITEEIRYESLQERLFYLVENNDGALVLPGGIGTLAELAMIWNSVQVEELTPRPIVCLGPIWRDTIQAFVRADYIDPTYAALLQLVDTPEEAATLLTQ